MKNAAKEIIYGVCDKTNKNDSYFGFFKNLEDAQKEILIQRLLIQFIQIIVLTLKMKKD